MGGITEAAHLAEALRRAARALRSEAGALHAESPNREEFLKQAKLVDDHADLILPKQA